MASQSKAKGAAPRRANLADDIAKGLRLRLRSGEMRPGDRMPTEMELSRLHGVSRTVVREAIAALRADGLVVARQGAGVFVAEPPTEQAANPFVFEPEKLSSVIEVLELRAAVEAEAAALSALRRSPAELAKIRECHQAFAAAIEAGDKAERQDLDLHLSIFESTHNRQFVEFFRFLGSRTIPRAQAIRGLGEEGGKGGFLRRIDQEHAAIVDAIAAGDDAAARAAMGAHLKGSQDRYARLLDAASLDKSRKVV